MAKLKINPKMHKYIKRTWPVVTFSNITSPSSQYHLIKKLTNCVYNPSMPVNSITAYLNSASFLLQRGHFSLFF